MSRVKQPSADWAGERLHLMFPRHRVPSRGGVDPTRSTNPVSAHRGDDDLDRGADAAVVLQFPFDAFQADGTLGVGGVLGRVETGELGLMRRHPWQAALPTGTCHQQLNFRPPSSPLPCCRATLCRWRALRGRSRRRLACCRRLPARRSLTVLSGVLLSCAPSVRRQRRDRRRGGGGDERRAGQKSRRTRWRHH